MRFLLGFAALSALLLACAPPYYLKNNAAGALDCPEQDVAIRQVSSGWGRQTAKYAAEGCGRRIVYRCPGGGQCDVD